MDFVDRLSGLASGRGPRSFASVLKFSTLSPPVQQYMQKVYATLTLALLACAVGAYVNATTGRGGLIGMAAFLIATPWLLWTEASPATQRKRTLLLGAAACGQGLILGPLVGSAAAVHPGVLVLALGGSAAIFGSFTLSALLARRRSYLFLGGVLGSAISVFFSLRLASWLLGSAVQSAVRTMDLYGGLVLFLGYVLYDTQLIVERAEAGDRDHLRAALELFVDAVAIFVRVLVILLRNAQRRDDDERRGERRGERRAYGGAHRTRVY